MKHTVVAFALVSLVASACVVESAPEDPESLGEQSQAFSESTCASNAADVDLSYAVNPPNCSLSYYYSDTGGSTYGHPDCTKGFVTEFSSTSGEKFQVYEPTWLGNTLTQNDCALAAKYVYVYGYLNGFWTLLTKSHWTGSWTGSSCAWVMDTQNGFGAPYGTSNSGSQVIKTVNTALYVTYPVRVKGAARAGALC